MFGSLINKERTLFNDNMMTGPKHATKYNPDDRLNGFTLKRNFKRTLDSGRQEWCWECVCDCGNIFFARENKISTRCGCISCTAAKKQRDISLDEHGIEQAGIKRRQYKEYRRGALLRGLTFDLSFEEFLDISSKNCAYCGAPPTEKNSEKVYYQRFSSPWKHNGIDRVDTTKGYNIENCVPCCSICNYAKHDLNLNEFKSWVKTAYNHMYGEGDVEQVTIK